MQPVTRPGEADARAFRERVSENVARVVVGKAEVVELCLCALLARGHILLEDVPGIGKTSLARALAASIGVSFSRVQFTSDLLPSDIVGSSVPDQSDGAVTGALRFKPGPVFTNVLLADELNRTSPRTQSSLLEAMSDGCVTVDGVTHTLPRPFLVIATQNPLEHHGTYPLPESQLDRFGVRLTIGYPTVEEERRLLVSRGRAVLAADLDPVASADEVMDLQRQVEEVRVDNGVADYVLAIAQATREGSGLAAGASTRAVLELTRLARARSLLQGRDYVTPVDVKQLARPALAHRLVPTAGADPTRAESEGILDEILSRVPVPE